MNIIKSLAKSETFSFARHVIAMPSGHNFNFYEHKMQKYRANKRKPRKKRKAGFCYFGMDARLFAQRLHLTVRS